MSNSNAILIKEYHFSSEDKLLFDTNIWMYIYGPEKPKPTEKVSAYSQALRDILDAKSRIYIDVLMISEFMNAYSRREWELHYKFNYAKFKDFRKSDYFPKVADEIGNYIIRILKLCEYINTDLPKLTIADLIDEYKAGRHDFNDQVIVELCKANQLKLVTHDADFKGQSISLLTANQKLLY